MYTFEGRVEEIKLDYQGNGTAWISCPKEAIPSPGQYVLVHSPDDEVTPLAQTVFPSKISESGFLAIPPIPSSWEPGTRLLIRGRLGQGFKLPKDLQRMGLIAMDCSINYLLPLATLGIRQGSSVALYADGPFPELPSALEAHPISAAYEAASWADFLGICLKLESLPELSARLKLGPEEQLACPAQVFVLAPMPCNGLAVCGVCAAPATRGWKMTCKDGPVFSLGALEW